MARQLLPDPRIIEQSRFEGEQFTTLWTVPLATYGVGDIVTTVTILWFSDRVEELNAVVHLAVDSFGLAGFVGLKLLVFGASLAISVAGARSDDPVLYYLPPVVLSVVGAFVTAINLQLFFS